MKDRDGQLLIKNDRNKWYSLDPKTRKVHRISEEEAAQTEKKDGGQPAGGA